MKQLHAVMDVVKNGLKPIPWTISPFAGILFKIVADDRPGVVKVIIKEKVKLRGVKTNTTSVIFVRDGYLIKPAPARYQHFMSLLGAKKPIHAQNLGSLFKKYNVPKSLRSIFLKSKDVQTVCLTLENVRKLLPVVEDQVKFYSTSIVYARRFSPKGFKKVYEFLKNVPANRRLEQMNYEHLIDTIRMTNFVKQRMPDIVIDYSMRAEALHQWASGEHNKILNPNYTIPYSPEMVESVELMQYSLIGTNVSVRLAVDTYELVRWGNELSHCIGTYGRSAVEGRSVLFGIFVGEELTYTIEADQKFHIRQFYGKRNSKPNVDHATMVRLAFKDCSLRSLASV